MENALCPPQWPGLKNSRDWIWQSVLVLPSIWCLANVPPLWRDTDGFNQIASTFAPKGIVHWLPGYCLFGRLVVIAAGVVASLFGGHGLPYLSIGTPQLSEAGIYALLLVQHAALCIALSYLVRALVDSFWARLACAVVLAFTAWMYTFANCIGSEAFSNPLLLLVAAFGWRCIQATSITISDGAKLFGFLLAACLTRQINVLLVVVLPLACLLLAAHCAVAAPEPRVTAAPPGDGNVRSGNRRLGEAKGWAVRCLVFTTIGVGAMLGSLAVQLVMCGLFRVPYRSTFGETFEWRLYFLKEVPAAERTRLFGRIADGLHDPVLTRALQALDASLARGEPWNDMFLYYAVDKDLERAGFTQLQLRTYRIDLKLNRLARQFIASADPNLLRAIWKDFRRVPAITQTEMAQSPFDTTDDLAALLGQPRYARLRPLMSFRRPLNFFRRYGRGLPYLHATDGISVLSWAVLALCGVVIAMFREGRSNARAAAYGSALVVTGILFALGTCASTFFGARLHLPVYSLCQIAGLLTIPRVVSIGRRSPGASA